MCFDQSVANQQAVFLRDEYFLFGQDYATNAIGHARYIFAVEFANVFVTVGAVDTALIAVNAQIEGRTMLNYRLVKRRQHHVRLVVHLRDWYYQQAVLLAGVATHQARAVIRPRLIRSQHLFLERLVKINQQVLIKF